MILIRNDNDIAIMQVSQDEVLLIANMANEALEAVDDWEFSTRLGFEKAIARNVAKQLAMIADKMRGNGEHE